MKKKIIAIILCLISVLISNLKGQDITGEWNGILDAMGTQVTLEFDIQKSDSGYTATFDSPDQGAMDIPFNALEYNDDKLILRAANIGAFYEGVPAADSISGIWNQGGLSFELNMYREKVEKKPTLAQVFSEASLAPVRDRFINVFDQSQLFLSRTYVNAKIVQRLVGEFIRIDVSIIGFRVFFKLYSFYHFLSF